jgi:hypothetical protein
MTARKRQSGFTVVELAVTVGVSLVLFAFVTQAIRGLMQLSSESLVAGRLEEAAGHVTTSMASELRWADPTTLLITAQNGSSRIDCQLAEGYDGTQTIWSTPVTFRYEPSPVDTNENGVLDEGSIVRIQDGRTRTLCRNVAQGGLAISVQSETVEVEVTVFGQGARDRPLQASARSVGHLLNKTTW